jgi:hypothetical protein
MTIARDDDGTFSAYAWPGGYPIFHVTVDCDELCAKCANEHGHTNEPKDDWQIIGSDINWEDENLLCVHCGERIKSAYGDNE